jgi:hypothetical protein
MTGTQEKLDIIREFDHGGRALAQVFAIHTGAVARFNAADKPVIFDAYFFRKDDLVAIAEIKTRKMPYDLAYVRQHGDELWFDVAKLEGLFQMSKTLCVPAVVLTRLADDTCWCHSLADPKFTYTVREPEVSKNQFSSDKTVKPIAAVPMALGQNFAVPPDASPRLAALLAHYRKFPSIKTKDESNG